MAVGVEIGICMTDHEILTKAIEKAIAGGWDIDKANQFKDLIVTQPLWAMYLRESTMFLFNHDFAKALWGEGCRHCRKATIKHGGKCEADYLYRLQQMVIAEHPIKYLGENI